MPVSAADIKRLVTILGPRGAAAGLAESDISKDDLDRVLHKTKGVTDTANRDQTIEILISAYAPPKIKPISELMQMPYEAILDYFAERSLTNKELMDLVRELDYKVGSEDKRHLRKFVARQISETALFTSVAGRKHSQ